jgi:SAM-dependent methyltransferase
MQSARLTNRRYFHEAYRTGIHGWETSEPSPFGVAVLKRLRREIPRGRLLDLGCGEARNSIAAARLGYKVTAADYEPLALKRARRFVAAAGATGIAFRRADALRLPFPDSRFDIVLDYGCLHHQKKSDWPAYRRNLLRVLKPRGFYVLSVFSRAFRLFHGSRRPWHVAHGAYRRRFTPAEIRGLFGRDFEIIALKEARGKDGGFWQALMRRRVLRTAVQEGGRRRGTR